MKELHGRYGAAKIFTDLVESEATDQVRTLLNQEFVSGSKIRIMPDVHAGAGCTIGTTMTVHGKCCPNLVGVDIGCGMHTTLLELRNEEVDLQKLDRVIREYIPSGFNIRSTPHSYAKNLRLDELICREHVDIERGKLSLGTLGGGNHFIEVDQDDAGFLYLVIHSGSRHLGLEVAKHYQQLAIEQVNGRDKHSMKDLIENLKAQGRQADIESELNKLRSSSKDIPKDLAYLSGQLYTDYIHDMQIVQEYAKWNRIAMTDVIRTHMDWGSADDFETIHNYIDTGDMILRKGAVSANKDEILLIPINMRDGSLLCRGKGNPDWNYSAPHGAGRLMSRSIAKKQFSMLDYEESMTGIFTTSINADTLDECPMAYKPIDTIINNIGDTVDILKIIRPIYNFKASE